MRPDQSAKRLESLFDAVPPSSIDNERGVLGSIMLRPSVLDDVAGVLKPDDFHGEQNQLVYRALLALRHSGRRIDIALLIAQLRTMGTWESVGGACLGEIAHATAVAAHAMDYAEIVLGYSKRRRLLRIGLDVIRDAHDLTRPVDELVANTEASIAKIGTGESNGDPVPIATACAAANDRVESASNRKAGSGVSTGFHAFDRVSGGLFPGELFILGARTSVGKTALALQIAKNVAMRGVPTYYASLEMKAHELATRIICEDGEVNSRTIRTGSITAEDLSCFVEAGNRVASASLVIHDRHNLSPRDVRRAAIRLGAKLIVVDYLTLLKSDEKMRDRYLEVGSIAKALKRLALEMDVPVLCLVQLGRQAEQASEPELHHIRESGDIEQDADVVGFLTTNVKWPGDKEPNERQALWLIKKNRNGPKARLRLVWEPEWTRFSCPESGQREYVFDAFDGR